MPEEIKLPEHIENALGYSRNYATAKPNIGNTEKEHILGLANLLEKTAAEANELRKDAERYQWLRSRDLETISHGGVFAGITPQNMVINEETLDEAIDAARAQEVQP